MGKVPPPQLTGREKSRKKRKEESWSVEKVGRDAERKRKKQLQMRKR